MSEVAQLRDLRTLPLAWISIALDDLPLSPEAFRVYLHLLRRVGKNDKAWPSYRTIGTHCFPSMKEESARSKAMRAVKELLDWSLIRVEKIQSNLGFHSNRYYLTDDSEWKKPSDVISPPSDVISPPSDVISPPSDVISPQYKDLPCKDFPSNDFSRKESPLTPQGEPELGGMEDENLTSPEEEPKPEPTTIAPSPQADSKPTHLPTQKITPEINHPAAVENHSQFLPTDTTAENMRTWSAIAATGAMKGASHPDPSFLEFYRLILSKCSHYKGRDCNANHAKAALKKLWLESPLKILAEAENWVASKAKFSKSTQTRDTSQLTKEERLALLQRPLSAKQQPIGA